MRKTGESGTTLPKKKGGPRRSGEGIALAGPKNGLCVATKRRVALEGKKDA